jgi:hypothetical protein
VLGYYTTAFLAGHGLGRRWLQPFAAFSASLVTIVLTGLIAPSHKLLAAVAITILLGYAGSEVLCRFDPITLQPTILPIGAGILGSVLGLTIVAILAFLIKKHSA